MTSGFPVYRDYVESPQFTRMGLGIIPDATIPLSIAAPGQQVKLINGAANGGISLSSSGALTLSTTGGITNIGETLNVVDVVGNASIITLNGTWGNIVGNPAQSIYLKKTGNYVGFYATTASAVANIAVTQPWCTYSKVLPVGYRPTSLRLISVIVTYNGNFLSAWLRIQTNGSIDLGQANPGVTNWTAGNSLIVRAELGGSFTC